MKQNGIFTKMNKFLISVVLYSRKTKRHEVGEIGGGQNIKTF